MYRPCTEDILDVLENVEDLAGLLREADFPEIDRDTVRDVIAAGALFVEKEVSPRAAALDREGCRLVGGRVHVPEALHPIWRGYVDGGWISLAIPRAQGGLGFPNLVQAAFAEMVCGASIAASMVPLLIRGAVDIVAAHAAPAIVERYLHKLVSGAWAATICITEPQAGSDVAAIGTKARERDDGQWEISGTKIFISFGDHDLTDGILHIVLARTDDGTGGARGLGLFAVPAENGAGRDHRVTPQHIEHKLGLHGSPTCVMNFEKAIGFPLGASAQGLQAIFFMINTMRLEVAVQGVGIASAATQEASRYASERIQGNYRGRPVAIVEHPDVKRNIMMMLAYRDGCRALVYRTARYVDIARYGRDDAQRDRADQIAAFLLPVCKAGCSDSAVRVANIALQVHGGHGYIRDTGVERLLRDARILPLYEGANGIQAIDLVLRKLPGQAFPILADEFREDISRAAEAGLPRSVIDANAEALKLCGIAADAMRSMIAEDHDAALSAATPFLDLIYKVALGCSWLRIATRSGRNRDRDRAVAEFYATQILPEAQVAFARTTRSAERWRRVAS